MFHINSSIIGLKQKILIILLKISIQVTLNFLVFGKFLRVVHDWRIDVYDSSCLWAGFGNAGKQLFFVFCIAFYRIYKIGNQIQAALVLVFNLTPGRRNIFVQINDFVVGSYRKFVEQPCNYGDYGNYGNDSKRWIRIFLRHRYLQK